MYDTRVCVRAIMSRKLYQVCPITRVLIELAPSILIKSMMCHKSRKTVALSISLIIFQQYSKQCINKLQHISCKSSTVSCYCNYMRFLWMAYLLIPSSWYNCLPRPALKIFSFALTYSNCRGLLAHIWVGQICPNWLRKWLIACSAPNHYLIQCWLIKHIGTNISEIVLNIQYFSFQKIDCNENVVCGMCANMFLS